MNFAIQPVDTGIVCVYLIAVVLFGMWIGRGKKDLDGYLLGGRDLPWWAILGSIVATETSTATFLSVPGIAYAAGGDMRFLQLAFGFVLGRMLVAVILLPQYFQGHLYTAYEVLHKQFGGGVKTFASLLFLVTRNLGDGLRLFLAGIALEKAIGIELHWCIVLIGLLTILYTFFGGMKAVVWSDCIQLVVYVSGGLIALYLLVQALPTGWAGLWEFGHETGRWHLFDLRIRSTDNFSFWSEPYTLIAGLLGGAVLSFGTHGTDQMMVQRFLCARNERAARRALILSGFAAFGQFALFLLLGVALACFYTQVDPRTFEHADEVLASYIVEYLPTGLIGLTLAAVFAAAMSTLSSSLNSSASAAVNDLYAPWHTYKGTTVRPEKMVTASRAFTIAFGVLQIAIGLGASALSKSVIGDALAIAGFAAGILVGVFLLGVWGNGIDRRAAFLGMLGGFVILVYAKFGTTLAWTWFAPLGALFTYFIGWSSNLFFSPSAKPPQTAAESRST
ncbi:Sodium/glucose cotransporter [Roseimaritima multifibrata]|uniref:Sodium/glucose cotransporter n=1 Tax=Roseimaritima multifibrata TaxID=1930274 RepID=A0A517MFE5_9BACT|nr:sodium:solute symporter [Roseimaritima multifibrata]QDS93611.1 Sodium/glucose cotransporter [Roseimaritima multifibrata]